MGSSINELFAPLIQKLPSACFWAARNLKFFYGPRVELVQNSAFYISGIEVVYLQSQKSQNDLK
jgi:hypothetical protein